MLHDKQRVVATDRFFICGGNPSGDGGGIIGTCNTTSDAAYLHDKAIKAGYTRVRIMTWNELMKAVGA